MIHTVKYLVLSLITIPLWSSIAFANYSQRPFSNSATMVAQSQPPQRAIDDNTDFFFYRLHPELGRRKISSDETQYINEWNAIREVVQDNLVYISLSCGSNTTYYWGLSQYDTYSRTSAGQSPVIDKIADAVFYTRHPELDNRKIEPGENDLASEWSAIRHKIATVGGC